MTTTPAGVAAQVTERPATALDEGFFRQVFVADRLPEFLAVLPAEQAEALVADQFRLQTSGYRAQFPHASHRVVLWRDRPVGRVIDADQGTHLLLVDLVLHPDARGLGTGTSIVRRIQDRARAASQPVLLHAVVGSPAVGWYESLGFRADRVAGDRVEMVWAP